MKHNRTRYDRRSIRLQGYDYSWPGAYFVTICTQHKACLFGSVVDGSMILNDAGRTIEAWYRKLENKFPYVTCDEYVIMPNHIHCIVVLGEHGAGAPCECGHLLQGRGIDASLGEHVVGGSGGCGHLLEVGCAVASLGEHVGSPVRGIRKFVGDDKSVNVPVGADRRVCPDVCPNADRRVCPNVRPNADRRVCPNVRPNADPHVCPNVRENADPCCHSNTGTHIRPDVRENAVPRCRHNDRPGSEHTCIQSAQCVCPRSGDDRPSLSAVMQWFKTMTTNAYIRGVKEHGWARFDRRVWQRNYYERIIRDERELQNVRRYIIDNPAKWASGREASWASGRWDLGRVLCHATISR